MMKADWILEASYISIYPWAAQDDGLFVRRLIGWKKIEKSGNKNVVLFLFLISQTGKQATGVYASW